MDHRCLQPLHWVQLICSQNSGNQLTHLISGLLQKMAKDRSQQPGKEIHSMNSWAKEFLSYWNLGPDTMACRSILVHQPGSSLKLVYWGDFYGVVIKFAWWIKSLAIKLLVTDLTSSPSLLPRNQGVGMRIPTFSLGWFPLATSRYP